MRPSRYLSWLLLPGVAALAVAACQHAASRGPDASEEPLLLLDEHGGGKAAPQPLATAPDNARCYVCHVNYEDEELAREHAKASVSCSDCHGRSDAHCADENNVTAPEVMYATAKIMPLCMSCHARDSLDQTAHKKLLNGTMSEEQRYCTRCHGEHRLKHRTRKWNKETGELIILPPNTRYP